MTAGIKDSAHPGEVSMGTKLVGKVELTNGQRVYVTSIVRPMEPATSQQVKLLRSTRILDSGGNEIQEGGMLAFGVEPNPDA